MGRRLDLGRRHSRRTATDINARLWRGKRTVGSYANRELSPAEVVLLVRHAEAISGRVLEIGCGGGRVLGYLVELSREVQAIDVSEAMLEHCRAAYPTASVYYGDFRSLESVADGQFDAILAPSNVLDVVSHDERRAALLTMGRLLAPGGRLLFSSHNLSVPSPGRDHSTSGRLRELLVRLLTTPPSSSIRSLWRLPRSRLNRRRLTPLEFRTDTYAVLNDSEGDFGALHYYIDRDHQQRQLEELGWELVDCLDADGRTVPQGESGDSPWLFYAARSRSDRTGRQGS